LQSPIAV